MEMNASYHQERLWFIDKFEAGNLYEHNPVYHNIPLILQFKCKDRGGINGEKLEESIIGVIKRHEVLRTTILTKDYRPVQEIRREVDFKLEAGDLSGYRGEDKHSHAVSAAIDYAQQPFRLEAEALIRGKLFRLSRDVYMLVIAIHHIISDRYSLGIIGSEILSVYRSLIEGDLSALPEPEAHYADFSQWQQEFPEDTLESLVFYWRRKLKGNLQPLEIPTDRPRDIIHRFRGAWQTFTLPPGLKNEIETFSTRENIGIFTLLLAGFNILLYRYSSSHSDSGQREIVVGTSLENRNQPGTEKIVGPLANLVVLRSILNRGTTFAQLACQLQQTVDEAYKYQAMPFDKLVQEIKPHVDMSRTALFDVLFQYEEKPFPLPRLENIDVTVIETNLGWGKYDLNLLMYTGGESLSGILVYNNYYYDDSTISRLIDHYHALLESIFRTPRQEISRLSFLSEKERYRILVEWNQTRANYPEDRTIHGLFEEQAARTPGNTALIGNIHITYDELNKKSNRLAGLLRKKGVVPGAIIGIMTQSSLEMIAGILGILKAGGVYLPIDPGYPEQRIVSMLDDSSALLLLTDTAGIKNKSFTRLSGIGGFAETGKIQPQVTETRPQIDNLDDLPLPDRSLVDYEKYNRYIGQAVVKNSMSLQATRGCPYNCAYCHKIWPKKQTQRSAGNIFAELELYHRLGVRRFAFIDDIFNLNIENSSAFFRMIIEKGLKVQLFFPNGMRGDLLTEDYIDLMVKAGTTGLALALETPSQRLQKLIGKNLNIRKLRENAEYFCKKYPHVILELFTMHGFPTETEEEAMMTLDFIKSLKWLHFPYVNILRIFPNTGMEKLALQNGISRQSVLKQEDLTQNDWAETIPFDKGFTLKYQTAFLKEYFLLKERLLHVLPYQMKVLTEDETVQKYNSFLGSRVSRFDELLELIGVTKDQLGTYSFVDETRISVPGLNRKLKRVFPVKTPRQDALRVLLLDTSQEFSKDSSVIYDVIEPPLGLMNLMSVLYDHFGNKVEGKIAKSRIDFDNFRELNALIDTFKPDVIGIRSLTSYKELFHRTAAVIKSCKSGTHVPVIAGGPYATSDYASILQDGNVDLVVLGEGEITFCEIIGKILENSGKLPDEEVLNGIKGIAFVPGRETKRQKGFAREITLLDEWDGQLSRESDKNPEPVNRSLDLSYIIFTSGTGGKPKGVMIDHKNVVRLMFNDRYLFDFSSEDVWTVFHSFCFDFSVWEMYGALLYGGKSVLVPPMTARNPGAFLELLAREKVTVLNQTPPAFYHLAREALKSGEEKGGLQSLRYVIFGGDTLHPARLKEWNKRYPGVRLINMYGITETTVHVTFKEITGREMEQNISSIGGPIPTLTVYVMSRDLELQPIGVPGELCVGGDGVCRGYLNRPELTAEKFIRNPYKPAEVIYRSGDRVRLLEDGEMEYLGRIDSQVKIRGFRIELREIEHRLSEIKDVKECVVIDGKEENGDKYLCAYFVSRRDIPSSELRLNLAEQLPGYMVPAYFIRLDAIPLTANNKIDREILPTPGITVGEVYAPPGNETEKQVAAVWAEVLNLDKDVIGRDSNFFEIGGNSLKVYRAVEKMKEVFEIDIPVVTLFEYPTIHAFSRHLEQTMQREEEISPDFTLKLKKGKDKMKGRRQRMDVKKNRVDKHV